MLYYKARRRAPARLRPVAAGLPEVVLMSDEMRLARAWPPRAIVAAVDFGEASARAVGVAGVIAAAGAATLRVLHAERFEVPPYFTPAQIERLDDERQEASAELTTELTRFVKTATTYPATLVITGQRPVDAILDAAADADLLVVGHGGRPGASRWWLGSVAERVIRGADVPVLVTPAGAADAPGALFARVVLVGDGAMPDEAAQAAVAALTRPLGGEIVATQALAPGGALPEHATMIALAPSGARLRWGLSEAVTDALGRSGLPVLFLAPR